MVRKVTEEVLKEESLKAGARTQSIKEGVFASAKSAFGDSYISPFAIAINSSNSMVALLSSISGLLGPLSQIFGSKLIEKYERKKIILRTVFWEFLMWLPMIAVALLFYFNVVTEILPLLFMFAFSFYIIFANVGGPAWFSWMGDLVNEKFRGRWFSKRNFVTGFVSILLALSASFFLDYFKKNGWIMEGFIVLFSLALVSRFLSWKVFKKQYEPKIHLKKSDYFSFSSFLINGRKTNFGKFTIFRAFLAFATSIAGPFFAIYMLRNLNFSYPVYMIVTLAGTVFSLIVLPIWGAFADKYGNYVVLFLTALMIPLVPLLWIVSKSPIYLILVPTLVSGIAWSGFGLAAGNFIYDNVSQQKRGLAVSYHNMLYGIGVFLGAGLGALLIKYVTVSFIEPILFIFILSGVARMIAVSLFIHTIKEARKTEKFDGKRALKNLILRQIRPALVEEVHEIKTLKRYLRI